MITTSGIFGTLALTVVTIFIFQFGAQKEHAVPVDGPTSHVVYELPDET
jgi:hypothetical protein